LSQTAQAGVELNAGLSKQVMELRVGVPNGRGKPCLAVLVISLVPNHGE
jgi:hypothetical protein